MSQELFLQFSVKLILKKKTILQTVLSHLFERLVEKMSIFK